jgi:hypothetical protein
MGFVYPDEGIAHAPIVPLEWRLQLMESMIH